MAGYKIALIVAGIDQSYQKAILNCISAAAAECSLNVEAFISFIGSMGNPKHDTGEFNIFRLPDFRNFDGAILLTNTIDYQPVVTDIINRIQEAGIPAVSMDNDIPELYHIGIDNKRAMRKITEHMINIHNYKKFCYISGPADNPESADRLSAFLDVLSAHEIYINKSKDIFYGDFRAPSGTVAIEYFLKQWTELPDAIICANDVMAASAINRLIEAGYKIPEDIAVTGFDNTYSSNNYQVELTSVERPLADSGKLACHILFDHFNKKEQKRSITLEMSTSFTESCGCTSNLTHDFNEIKDLNYNNYMRFEKSQRYMSLFNRLSCDLLGCNNFDEYIQSIKNFVPEVSPEEFYFCLCDGWDSESIDEYENKTADIPTEYTEEMIVPIAYKQGIFYENVCVASKDILPSVANSPKTGRFYYMIPLHFGERCLGYMAILNPVVPIYNTMFETLCISISNSLENIRKLICLESAVKRLDKLYAMDTFSNIYNRNGFVKATNTVYADCVRNHSDVMLMFIDLDGLKKINDTYGHSIGDNAICNIADVLRLSCTKNEIYCRFGGDEFIIFAADYTDEDAKALTKKIEQNIKNINSRKQNPFELSASTGYVIAKPNENEDIFRFVTEADKIMYEEKRKKKLSKYLKS